MKRNAMQQVVIQLAQSDPKAAIQLAFSQTGNIRRNTLSIALSQWVINEIDSTMNYFAQMPQGSQKNQMVQSMVYQVAQQDPASAVALLDQLPAGQQQDSAILNLARNWRESDPQAALS